MGLWDTLKQHAGAQFLDVIDWTDDTKDTVVYRFPVFNQAITSKSKLVVREGQAGVFVAEGKLSDVFGPGTYTLDTRNTPVATFFKSIAYALDYPYKGDIYFVSTRQFTDNKWGTPNPIMMRDAEFGPLRIRGFGIYSFRVTDPATFLRQIVGTDGLFTTDEITGQLKRKLVAALADTIGEARIPVLDLAANYLDLGDTLRDRMNPSFGESYGITLTDFTIENISLPEAVEKALDERSKMGVLGDLNAYTQLQAAESIKIAAANKGLGGAGIGMGVGFGMGNMVGGQMANAMGGPQGGGGAPPPLPGAQKWHYNGPDGQSQLTIAEIAGKVQAARGAKHLVWKTGMDAWKSWSDVAEVAAAVPPAVAPPLAPGATRFHYNGPGGDGEKTLAEIVALLKADPDGKHHVWQKGWDGWKKATDVAALGERAGRPAAAPRVAQRRAGPAPTESGTAWRRRRSARRTHHRTRR